MSETYDVVVIGTGIGGIGCGALTSHAGLKTLVLERNNFTGGRCGSYEKDGCMVDTFTHMFGSCEKGPIGEICRRAEMPEAIKFWHVDPKNKPVLLMGGKSFVYPDLSFATQEDLEAMYRGFEMPEKVFQEALRLSDDIYNMPFEQTHELDDTSYLSFISQYATHDKLMSLHCHRAMLTGVMVRAEASAGEIIRVTQTWHLRRNLGYPYGGSQAVPDGFQKIIETYGGEVRTGAAVASILVEKGRVTGVKLKDGQEIQTRAVVSNAGVKETVLGMVDPNAFQSDYLDYVKQLSSGIIGGNNDMTGSMLNIKVLLDHPVVKPPVVFGIPTSPLDEPPSEEAVAKIAAGDRQAILDHFAIYMPVPSNMDPSLAPEGKQLLTFNGKDQSNDIAASVNKRIDELDLVFPGFKKAVLWWDVVKGSAIKGYSGRFQSDFIGLAQIVGQVGDKRPSIESPVEGLFFACADVGQDHSGTELAAESALRAADKVRAFLDKPSES